MLFVTVISFFLLKKITVNIFIIDWIDWISLLLKTSFLTIIMILPLFILNILYMKYLDKKQND